MNKWLLEMIKFIFVLVISYISLSNACSCYLPTGWQDEFYCRYNFAGTFKVLSSQYDCSDIYENKYCYNIVVLDQMRGPSAIVTHAQTATEPNLCGTTLIQGHTYFVSTGVGDSQNIGVGLCMLLEDWTDLSCAEIQKKKKHYKQLNCNDPSTVPPTVPPTSKPQEPECVRTTKLLDLNYLLCILRKFKEQFQLRYHVGCNKCDNKCH